MAYNILYYFDTNRGGHSVRLNILKRYDGDSSIELVSLPKKIGSIQSLNLEIQGGDNAPETAITSTALHFSIEDCYDKPNQTITTPGEGVTNTTIEKYGGWEEFYTPDATLYRAVLIIDGTTEWAGFLTPDAWEEDLRYHSFLSLTARDNLGHLRDLDFDLAGTNGMVTASEVIAGAIAAAGSPMTLQFDIDDLQFIDGTGTARSAAQACFCLDAFSDKSWYDVLESVLDALGLVIRFVGGAKLKVCTLREWSCFRNGSRPGKAVKIANNSGHRSLSPALRRIVEVFKPEAGDDLLGISMRASDYKQARISPIGDTYEPSESSVWERYGVIGMINPFAVTGPAARGSFSPAPETSLFISMKPSIPSTAAAPYIGRRVYLSRSRVTAVLRVGFSAYAYYTSSSYENIFSPLQSGYTVTTLHLAIRSKAPDATAWQYFDGTNGTWSSSFKKITESVQHGQPYSTVRRYGTTRAELSVEMDLNNVDALEVLLLGFTLTASDTSVTTLLNDYKLYGYIDTISLTQDSEEYPEVRTTTIYDARQNTTLERSPKLGPVSFNILSARSVRNGIYYLDSGGAYLPMAKWKWSGSSADPVTLAALVHQQLLAFHSKANNVITGTFIDATNNAPTAAAVYEYAERPFLLCGGSINMFTGMIDNGVLRELMEYDDLWTDGTAYPVYLTSVGPNKTKVIAAVKDATGLSLPEAKTIVESAPCQVYVFSNKNSAQALVDTLTELGAVAE